MPLSKSTKYIVRYFLVSLISLSALATHASSFSVKDFEVYYDTSSGNKGDIYLHSAEKFIPIGTDIIVPIILPSKGTVQYSHSNKTVSSTRLDKQSEKNLKAATENTHYFYEDINEDSLLDVLVYSPLNDGSGVVFYGGKDISQPIATTFDFTNAPASTRFASTSQIKSTSSATKVFTSKKSNIDMLTVAIPNASGLSINNFSQFSTQDRTLRILNKTRSFIDAYGNKQYIEPAKRIIISAEDIDLVNPIEVVGARADVIIISPFENGKINCRNCSFKNANRISLLTTVSNKKIGAKSTSLGLQRPGLSSSIEISNLSAPASIGLDIATNKLTVTGTIDTHQYADKTASGYVDNINGLTVIAAAELSILLGQVSWVYETGQVTSVVPNDKIFTLSGYYKSASVNIITGANIKIDGHIDTTSDVLAGSRQFNGVYIPKELVSITTVGDSQSKSGNINLLNNIHSNGVVTIQATNNIILSETIYDTAARKLTLIAGNNITNLTDLSARVIDIKAKNVFNTGGVNADIEMHIFTDYDIVNQYGGHLSGENIFLVSHGGVVRNGSRTPHISFAHETANPFDYANSNTWLKEDLSFQGTYYEIFSSVVLKTDNLTRPAKNNAHIVANRLRISSLGFENINPYYRSIDYVGPLQTSGEVLNQVVVSAEESLIIGREVDFQTKHDYILNSSAYLILNNPESSMKLVAATVLNERYRVATTLNETNKVLGVREELVSEEDEYGYFYEYETELVDSVKLLGSQTVIYSPPGRILSMGDVSVTAVNVFSNNMSYIEIFGDLTTVSNQFESLGIQNQMLTRFSNEYIDYTTTPYNNSRTSSLQIETRNSIVDPQNLDSIFEVKGFVDNSQVNNNVILVSNLLENYATLSVEKYKSSFDNNTRGEIIKTRGKDVYLQKSDLDDQFLFDYDNDSGLDEIYYYGNVYQIKHKIYNPKDFTINLNFKKQTIDLTANFLTEIEEISLDVDYVNGAYYEGDYDDDFNPYESSKNFHNTGYTESIKINLWDSLNEYRDASRKNTKNQLQVKDWWENN